ncbi:MAG: GAF domain-containing protein [Anaerolineae bacterium]
MFKWIKNYFTLPVFADDEQQRVARLLMAILLGLTMTAFVADIFVFMLYGIPAHITDTAPYFGLAMLVISVFLAPYFIRRGWTTAIAIWVLLILWLTLTYWLWTVEGFSGGRTSFIHLIFVIFAALLLGPRGAVGYTVLALVSVAGALYLEKSGHLSVVAPASNFDMIAIFAVLSIAGFFLRYAMKSMQDAMRRARLAAQAQAEANRELDAIRRSLEERVAARTQDLQSRSTLLLTAIELGRAAASLRDLETLVSQMPQMIAEQTGFYHVGLFLMDEYGEYAILRGTNSPEGHYLLAQHFRVALGAPDELLGTVIAKREFRVAVDTGPNAVSFAGTPFRRTRSELALPLIAGDRLVGALDLHSTESGILTDQMIEVMRLLADQLAIAIESAQLFAQSQAALAAEQRAYGAVSREAWREMALAQSTTAGGLRLLADAPGVIRPAAGEKPAVMQQARQTGRTIVQPVAEQAETTLAVPIQVREGVSIGALRLNKSSWAADEIALVETLTEQLGAALESARLYQETQRREARERITREITEDIRRSVDMEVILRSAVTNLGEALGVPRTYVRLMLGEESASVTASGAQSPREPSPDEKLPDQTSSGELLAADDETPADASVKDLGDGPPIATDRQDVSDIVMKGLSRVEGDEHDEP